MTENDWNESKKEQESAPTEPSYLYRWNYGEQRTFDLRVVQNKKRSGLAVYALVMTAVFLLCFAVLLCTLIWYEVDLPASETHDGTAGEGMSTGDVAELVTPSTVLIYASDNISYGYGTGFFLRSDGYIATNYHVLEGKKYISVTLYSGEEYEAELIGYSAADDLAVIKIEGSGYPAVSIGDSDALRVGDVAIAIGNPSGTEASWSTTQGLISALNRAVTVEGSHSIEELTMIQTDAALNPGNSGGPLCNDRGEVVGVVARKLSDTEGISFAIPINGAMEILNAIIKDGDADGVQSSVSKVRPTIGITGGTVKTGDDYTYRGVQYTAARDGVLVSTVDSQGAASGILQVCDIIIAMDGEEVSNMEALIDLLYEYKVGDKVDITVWRDGEAVTVSIVLGGS